MTEQERKAIKEAERLARQVVKLGDYVSQFMTRELNVENALGIRGSNMLNKAYNQAHEWLADHS